MSSVSRGFLLVTLKDTGVRNSFPILLLYLSQFERRNYMKYLKQFTLILAYSCIGELLHTILPLPIPASIYGIALLFLSLEFKIIKLEKVKDTGKFLIEIMPVMFIPSSVGLMDSWGLMKASLLPYIAIPIISTILVMGVSAWITQLIVRLDKKNAN